MLEQEYPKCYRCYEACYGDTYHVKDKLYHTFCFSCIGCNRSLSTSGYFTIDDNIYCPADYHAQMGVQCAACALYVEGDAVEVVQSVYHPSCFTCRKCRAPFPAGAEIHYDGSYFFCKRCVPPGSKSLKRQSLSDSLLYVNRSEVDSEESTTEEDTTAYLSRHSDSIYSEDSTDEEVTSTVETVHTDNGFVCAGCSEIIEDTKMAFRAVDKCWHIQCFSCSQCGLVLLDEFIARNEVPYCEKDYLELFGVTCNGCGEYVSGEVIEAGAQHYHPRCARCTRCGDIFGVNEDMYILNNDIWHEGCNEERIKSKKTEIDTIEIEKQDNALRKGGMELWLERLSGIYAKSLHRSTKTISSLNPKPWKPVPMNTYPKPYVKQQSSQTSPTKVPGFRSVKPPVSNTTQNSQGNKETATVTVVVKELVTEDRQGNVGLDIQESLKWINSPISLDNGSYNRSGLHGRKLKNMYW